jgi:hypothetical protein
VEIAMLKEVGASGQISLGKKYAGQLFDMTVQPDGSIVMQPVKVVPVTPSVQEEIAVYTVQPVPSEALDRDQATREWAESHATQIDQYNAWVLQHEPYAQRVRRWREQAQNASATNTNP